MDDVPDDRTRTRSITSERGITNGRVLLSEIDRDEIRARLQADHDLYVARIEHFDARPDMAEDRAMLDTAREALVEIDAALLRLDSAEYGYCTRCGEWIAVARLLALPHARHCLECAATHM